MRIARMYLNLLLWCHWLGCLWYFVGSVVAGIDCSLVPSGAFLRSTWQVKRTAPFAEEGAAPEGTPLGATAAFCTWTALNGLGDVANATVASRYLKSVHWATTSITSVGYGEIKPVTSAEFLYAVIAMVLGAGIYAMIFSQVVSYITRLDMAYTRFEERMEEVRRQMIYLRLPSELQDKVVSYFEYLWLRHKNLLEKGTYFFDELPPPLHLNCANQLYRKPRPRLHESTHAVQRHLAVFTQHRAV